MLTRREFNKLLLASILLPSYGCNFHKKIKYVPNTLRLNLGYEPDSLDWARATDSYSFDIIANIMTGLTKYNNDLRSVPSLAQNWNISPDGKTYTFYLDKNAKWSDGVPVLARDFEYGWKRILDPLTAGPYAYLLYPIKNAQKYNSGLITNPNQLGIRALNDYLLQVELAKPLSFFLNLTSWCVFFPQRKDIIQKYGDDWTEPGKLISCGPFKLDKWQHEYKITLIKNDYYKNPEPLLEKIKYYIVSEQSSAFSLYLNDELDCIDSRSIPVSEIETVKGKKETSIHPLLRGTYIGFNVEKPPFDNKLVRAAFSASIDRNIFPKILRRSEIPSCTWIPPGLAGFYSPDIGMSYNIEHARKLLTLAGYPDGKNFPKVSLYFPTREDAKLISEAVQSCWKKVLNIEVELVNLEWKVFLDTLHKDPPHLFRLSWGADYPDPDTFMTLFTSDSGNNHGRWKNKSYDEIVNIAASEMNITKRKSLYRNAQKILLEEEVGIAPLFFNTQIILNKPWIKNFEFNSMDLVFCEKISVGL
jgi:oligopeptide transport system substrate-binding protein